MSLAAAVKKTIIRNQEHSELDKRASSIAADFVRRNPALRCVLLIHPAGVAAVYDTMKQAYDALLWHKDADLLCVRWIHRH